MSGGRVTLPIHADEHAPGGPDGISYAVWHIALSGDRVDDDPVEVDTDVFKPPISRDMTKLYLRDLMLGLGTESSSGDVEVMIRNETQAVDMLSTDAAIPAGDKYADNISVIVSPPDNQVFEGDIIAFDITSAGTDAKGLKAILVFRR